MNGVGRGAGEAWFAAADGPLVAPVLGRVVGMLAARAECPIDRLQDALLVTDAIAAKAGRFSGDGRVGVGVVAVIGSVELRVGPLHRDGAAALAASVTLPGVGNVLERLADELECEQGAGGAGVEYLRIRLAFDGRRPPAVAETGPHAA